MEAPRALGFLPVLEVGEGPQRMLRLSCPSQAPRSQGQMGRWEPRLGEHQAPGFQSVLSPVCDFGQVPDPSKPQLPLLFCQDRKSWKRTQGLGAGAGMEVTRGTADQSGHSNLEQEKGNYHLLIPALCREPPSCGSDGEESACNAGDLGLIPGLGTSLEKEMATHSSIPAWRIHGQRSLVGSLGSMGSQRIRHD